ncbi:telomere repeat-binding protein 3-like isoform X2 [Asparagus officinalis]|uniref:telomere repeat-binding protein 3-like isoform X2 n=1 Tax=Asparagus officinalis TaxID=4686 RepID=UPI00098DE595|nr:telomere repeat-binding protein 3-like isoform X2 [Asparagus officinalis]
MVLKKRLLYGNTGYRVPPIPNVPKSAKGKRSVRKKTAKNGMCAFDLLAEVAEEILLEGETSPNKIIGTPNANSGKDTIKEEQLNDEKPVKDRACDLGSCNENLLGPDHVAQGQVSPKKCSQVVLEPSGAAHALLKSDTFNKEGCSDKQSTYTDKLFGSNVKDETIVDRNASNTCSLVDNTDVDTRLHALTSSDSRVKVPHCGDHILRDSFSPQYRDEKLLVDRDDDENLSGRTNSSIVNNKTLKNQGIEYSRIRKQLATKFWKIATTIRKDRDLSNADVEMKSSFRKRKICYTRQRTQRSSFKRRKVFQRCSISTYRAGIISEVKLRIKSFTVPELFIEIPETSTVGSLKRTVMEAVTAIFGGGLHVGVLRQGKKVRDDNKTLVQAGISHGDKSSDLNFILEPSSSQALPLLSCPEEPHLLLPNGTSESLSRFQDLGGPTSGGGKSDVGPESQLTPTGNSLESNHNSSPCPADNLSLDKTAEDARPLTAIPSMNFEALPMVPVHKTRESELVHRRIRRPFSVSEVEALVQAVEKLGTGRWRDVKIRAFDNAKHRTYVDLKDKWKTLVHTAQISPQQRRGQPVPQELLDRVLSAHSNWSQQQAKLQSKPPAC